MRTVFALTSGRSGTRFLADLLHHNAQNCVCRHEPMFDWSNPTLFGPAIFEYAQRNFAALRQTVAEKQRWILRQRAECYVETSHAFLKSWFELCPEFFPDSRFIHLVRNPLRVARSEAERERLIHRWRLPCRNYRATDGRLYFRWALTGLEPIFPAVRLPALSRFQWYLVQWIEIENRAQQFLAQFRLGDACWTLDSPRELNDPERMRALFEFLGIHSRHEPPAIRGFQNRTPGVRTETSAADQREFEELLAAVPDEYLCIFQSPPYTRFEWAAQIASRRHG